MLLTKTINKANITYWELQQAKYSKIWVLKCWHQLLLTIARYSNSDNIIQKWLWIIKNILWILMKFKMLNSY